MVKLMQQSNGQYMVTLPKNLVKAIGLTKGDTIEFEINKKGRLELIKK